MSFDISRLRRADQIVGGGAVALFIFMFFFNWFGVSSNVSSVAGVNVNISKSGWDTFTNSRWLWLLTIIVALAAVIAHAAARRIDSPVQPSVIVAALGALSSVFILYRILHHPTASASVGGFHASVGIKIGIWLGLIAALAITYGGYLMMQAEGTSLADVRQQAGGAFSGITVPGGGPSGGSGAATAAPGTSPAEPVVPAAPSAPAAPDAPPIPPPAPPPGEAAGGGSAPPPSPAG
jgi:hypothetical protein